jgi:CHAD domain-containing protein
MWQTPLENARRVLPGMADSWFNEGDATLTGSHDALHRFRLSGKRLRYTLELFAELYEGGIDQSLKGLRSVQDRLGAIQDCVASMDLLKENPRAQTAIRKLLAIREQDFRAYWIRKIAKRRKLWIASLERTEATTTHGDLPSSPRQSRAARSR